MHDGPKSTRECTDKYSPAHGMALAQLHTCNNIVIGDPQSYQVVSKGTFRFWYKVGPDVEKCSCQGVEQPRHFQTPVNTSSWQCLWYHVLHTSHSAISSSFSSGMWQEQWRSTVWFLITPLLLCSPDTGNWKIPSAAWLNCDQTSLYMDHYDCKAHRHRRWLGPHNHCC